MVVLECEAAAAAAVQGSGASGGSVARAAGVVE